MSVGNLALSDRSSGEDSRTGQARGFDRFRVGWKIWAIWFFAFFIISAIVPRDAHFDAAHYHLHNGWSFWAGRLDQDFAPSEMHSFLNPFHSAIVWLLVSTLPGPLAIGLLGLVQAVILPGLYALLARLAWRLDIDVSPAILFAIALACFTSQPMIIMLSSVLNDHWGAATFLFALVLLVPHDREMPGWKALVAGSVLVGAGFGMKLTNAVYVVGYAAAVLVIMPGWQARLRACAICAAAGLGAVLLTGGWWAWMMYERFGNPIFPNLNALFDAPLGPDTAFRDEKFLPGSFLEGALRPFWFSFDASPINEQPTRDFRLLAGYLAALAIPVVAGIRWRSGEAGRQDRALLALSLGFLVTFTAWTAIFSIQRYAMGLYLIGPALLVAFAGWLFPRAVPTSAGRLVTFALVGALLLSTSFERLRRVPWQSWNEPYVWTELPASIDPDGAIIVMSSFYPSAFTAPAFASADMITHADARPWSRPALAHYREQVRAEIQSSDRPVYGVMFHGQESRQPALARMAGEYGLTADFDECERLRTAFDTSGTHWLVCPLRR